MWRTCSGIGQAGSRLAWFLAACAIGAPASAEARDYPRLFGSYEFYSQKIAHFPRWTRMLERQAQEQAGCDTSTCTTDGWNALIEQLRGKPLERQLLDVNDLINARRYVLDEDNWPDADYWATPYEFLKKSGDCEDFAVAKYMALKAAGVPVEDMRVVVMWDAKSNDGHAALVVYVGGQALLLDNLIATVVRADSVTDYRAIYSINETGWWLHKYLAEEPPQVSFAPVERDSGG